MLNEKNYIFICIGLCLIVLLGIASFNYIVDPADIFAGKFRYEKIAKEFCSGKTIAVASNCNERLLKKDIIENIKKDFSVVVIGSSRVMTCGEDNMPSGTTLMNLGVSGGELADDIALWHCYKQSTKNKPDMIIIGVDPWIFNRNNKLNRWQEHLDIDYRDAVDELKLSKKTDYGHNKIKDYYQLLSIKYTEESWQKYKKNIEALKILTHPEMNDEYLWLIYSDGSIEYAPKTYKKDSDEAARSYIKGKVYLLEDYHELDKELQDEFVAFIYSIQKQGIKILFYFPPYHPIVYDYLSHKEEYKCVLKADDWLRDFARKNGIETIGYYDPSAMGLDSEAFFDGMHLKRQYMTDYIKQHHK